MRTCKKKKTRVKKRNLNLFGSKLEFGSVVIVPSSGM